MSASKQDSGSWTVGHPDWVWKPCWERYYLPYIFAGCEMVFKKYIKAAVYLSMQCVGFGNHLIHMCNVQCDRHISDGPKMPYFYAFDIKRAGLLFGNISSLVQTEEHRYRVNVPWNVKATWRCLCFLKYVEAAWVRRYLKSTHWFCVSVCDVYDLEISHSNGGDQMYT